MKKEQVEKMRDLSNWTDTKEGRYTYRVNHFAWYEIAILYHMRDTDILTAKAELFHVIDYRPEKGYGVFERERIDMELPVFELLKAAAEDLERNYVI